MKNPQSTIRSPQSRIGVFGGSFDPVHRGHIILAECCLEQAKLDSVWFVPAAQQPLKPQGPIASNTDRLAMLQQACTRNSAFHISEIEFNRGGVSYTFDTLRTIQQQQPTAELFFLMGADSLADLPRWHRPEELCQLATLLVVNRAGMPEPDFEVLREYVSDDRLEDIRQSQVEMPATPISSSRIREEIANQSVIWENLVPKRVAQYIKQHGLYRR